MIAPPPRTPVEALSDAARAYEITTEGLLVSACVGALFGAGSSFLEESKPDHNYQPRKRRSVLYPVESLLGRTLGWAFLAAGIYVALPVSVRRSWST